MQTSADLLAQKLAEIASVDASIIGTFVEQDGELAVVDVGDSRIHIPSLGQVYPVAGDRVRLMRIDRQVFLLGTVGATRSAVGKVTAAGSPRCTVEYPPGSGVTQLMGYPSNVTPAVNNIAVIDWTSGGTIVALVSATPDYVALTPPPPPAYVPPAAPPTPKKYSVTFRAKDSGTQNESNANFWNNEVWASDTTRGAWFYSTSIRDTIPNSAVINSAKIYLPIRQNYGANPNMALHTAGAKPAGLIPFGSQIELTGTRYGWVDVPLGWIDYLKVNTGGLGMNHGGWNIYRGVQADALSGALAITWTA